ncbi:MAG TPA: TFIIB-type zinc finger domain-containing protein [Pyrinomonadaceae bacterium]|nr:TFIIB-type zinc finger domain-containing protein [Pyrinomonadaceae bacterium]
MQPEPPTTSPEKVHRYPCPACGAVLLFEPRDGFLTCLYCGHKEEIPASAEQVEERSFEQYLQIRPEHLAQLAPNALEVRCQSCGATVTFTPPEVAGQCQFCGVQIVAQPKSADPLLAPGGVLPFRFTQKQADAGLRQWLQSRWFAPNALKQFAQPDSITGVYLPFWTYDTHTISYYTGERGEYYYVTETYVEHTQGRQQTRTRQVRHTRWRPASGAVSRWFDDVLVPAATSLPQNRLDGLEPWDLTELKPYDPAFLSGFKAQRYQVDLAQGFERVKQIAAGLIKGDVRQNIGGDEQRIHSITTQYSAITFKHLLLPVYAGAYRFNQKVFQIIVNGRTGEIQGDRPYSFWKIALLVLSILFILLMIVVAIGLAKD